MNGKLKELVILLEKMSKIVLSGMQSSGILHLGNYIGALLNWKKLIGDNSSYKYYFMIADLHSLTSIKNGNQLQRNIFDAVKCYIASGIDPKMDNICIFQQSKIVEHTELAWIFQTITPIGWMERMTQFKDKSESKDKERINLGLFTYPTLMAADILLYMADFVPIGEDQKQHVELTRDIAMRFNREYNCDIFKEPEPIILDGKRIMSLRDGTKKMSKSDEFAASRILLTDTKDEICQKISKAKTDSISGIYYNKSERPEISNLIQILASLENKNISDIENTCKTFNTKQFKDYICGVITEIIEPIRLKISKISDADVRFLLQNGNLSAKAVANDTMLRVREIIGISI